MNASGKVFSNERFLSTKDALYTFLDRFDSAKFVLESTGIWEFIDEGIERRGKQRATVATARKLLHTIYWMLLTKEEFHCQGFNLVEKAASVNA
jgi:hypothetical protein